MGLVHREKWIGSDMDRRQPEVLLRRPALRVQVSKAFLVVQAKSLTVLSGDLGDMATSPQRFALSDCAGQSLSEGESR